MKMQYHGITTNNIRNVDLEIDQGQVVFFSGPSGSGKSSIAIDTIHKISEDEFFQLCNVREDISTYAIKDYDNILPSVCLQQENYNQNPRSTIATYFSLDIHFKELFSLANNVSKATFQFNTRDTWCEACCGSGVSLSPDPLTIVDFDCKVLDLPFRPWRISSSEYYQKSLLLFCEEHGIPPSVRFQSLSAKQQDLLLNSESENKYKIEFRSNRRKHTKTSRYYGPLLELQRQLQANKLPKHRLKYFAHSTCGSCNGGRFSADVLKHTLYGKNIGELYLLETDVLLGWIREHEKHWKQKPGEARPFRRIVRFLESLARLNLNYLQLNRSIPSLSGGELQRLRLAKATTSHFTNFLYVLDEPTSGLHPSEWKTIADVVSELKRRNNTVLLIEHNGFLRKVSDRIVCLGPGGGKNGGMIVPDRSKPTDTGTIDRAFFPADSVAKIRNATYNNIVNGSFDLPMKTLVGVCGVSGSGKTSLLSGILPRHLENTQYFSQSPIRGNAYSIVATAVGGLEEIQKMFSERTKAPKEYFTFSSKGKGQCATCLGKGIIEEESVYLKGAVICPSCGGRRFAPDSWKHRVEGCSIYEFLSLSIDEIVLRVPAEYRRLKQVLELLASIGLGYLTLFQNVSTLSGGEAQRIKFAGNLLASKTRQVYLLDEPFRGVDRANITGVMGVLYSLVKSGSTVILAEHNPFALGYCSYILEFGPGSGAYGGKVLYLGEREGIAASNSSKMARFLV